MVWVHTRDGVLSCNPIHTQEKISMSPSYFPFPSFVPSLFLLCSFVPAAVTKENICPLSQSYPLIDSLFVFSCITQSSIPRYHSRHPSHPILPPLLSPLTPFFFSSRSAFLSGKLDQSKKKYSPLCIYGVHSSQGAWYMAHGLSFLLLPVVLISFTPFPSYRRFLLFILVANQPIH